MKKLLLLTSVLAHVGCGSPPESVKSIEILIPRPPERLEAVDETLSVGPFGARIARNALKCDVQLSVDVENPKARVYYSRFLTDGSPRNDGNEMSFYIPPDDPRHKELAAYIKRAGHGILSTNDRYREVCLAGPLNLQPLPPQ